MQLQDEGALSLSDPIAQYVPGVPDGDEITLDDLGLMRSGLANYTTLPALQEAIATRTADPVSTDTLLEWGYAASPNFAPGARYGYSNTNTLLLGQVIEAVTGGSWFDA